MRFSTERAEACTPYRVRASPRRGEERRRLTDEEPHRRQEIDNIHGNPLGFSGTDDLASWQLAIMNKHGSGMIGFV